ncbi:Riboflavin synthase alpha chain, partial [Lobulomyces angularis]
IVEQIGKVFSITVSDSTESGGGGFSLVIENANLVLDDAKIGDSIAVNGVCLTITEITDNKTKVKFGIAPETLRKTNLGELKVGSVVNLERAMSVGQRFSGHFVQGHVDTTVKISKITQDPPNSVIFEFTVSPPSELSGGIDFLSYIIPKGYICLDGTSLTVVSVDQQKRTFTVMLIKYTQDNVIMMTKKVGDSVNIEGDQLAKYVEKVVMGMLFGGKFGSEGRSEWSEGDQKVIQSRTENQLELLISKIVDEKLSQHSKNK